MDNFKIGDKVEIKILSQYDLNTTIKVGDKGIIRYIEDMNQLVHQFEKEYKVKKLIVVEFNKTIFEKDAGQIVSELAKKE